MSLLTVDKHFLGKTLLKKGFETWFRYMFRVIEGKNFIIEPIHPDLFETFEKIYNLDEKRVIINIPPRSGKTTIAKYFVVYAITINNKCNFIYTSFSQALLGDISRDIMNILEHPVYKAMYPSHNNIDDIEENPIDEFWHSYLLEQTGKATYTNKKIVTQQGGVLLFASIGSAITGFGCGIRGAQEFSGSLIVDDANKPSDIHSVTLREKVIKYYEETLLTRLNDGNVPVCNIQQRLNLEDLSGVLIEKYDYYLLKKPLIIDGFCQIPSQYSEERIKEIEKNNFVFQSQYQQNPISIGGNLIKSEWFKRFNTPPHSFKSMYIIADTAFSEKKSADYSAFGLFGIDEKDHIYLLDAYSKKVIFPDLRRDLKSFYQKAVNEYGHFNSISTIYIENKGSGISLIQQLREDGLPVSELQPTHFNKYTNKEQVADKYTRFLEVSSDLESGYFYIPEYAHWLLEFIQQCEAFTGGKQDYKDDFVDILIYALKQRRKSNITDWSAYRRAFGL